MADFVQTMKDWKRMCASFNTCEECPMDNEDGWVSIRCSEGGIQFAKAEIVERVIAKWAAEHPEPVYPTWYDWMAGLGLDPDDPIPADIAQKLGIEPKENT